MILEANYMYHYITRMKFIIYTHKYIKHIQVVPHLHSSYLGLALTGN